MNKKNVNIEEIKGLLMNIDTNISILLCGATTLAKYR